MKKIFTLLFIFIVIVSFFSCGKLIIIEPIDGKYEPLDKVYKKIILQKFEVDQDLENKFSEAVISCESITMNGLLKKNAAPIIEKARLSTSKDASALIVQTRIISIKMASSSARGLSGEYVGKSKMAAEVKLIDAQTRNILRKEILSTDNISLPPASGKHSDRNVSTELGKMIAEYIYQSIGNN
ncbi:MAG: hypothetical protein JW914_03980 [Syntrophaceae bacterium]|nr:hypothetical protein [Syntrophaceae bacterium]